MALDYKATTTQQHIDDHNGYDQMRAAIEENIAKHDRHVQMVPRFNEDGSVVAHTKTGNTMVDFAYTVGNYETHGTPELVTWYPGAKSAHWVLNTVSKMMAAKHCPIPTEVGQLLTIENMFEGPAKIYVYKMDKRQLAHSQYEFTCRCDDKAAVLVVLMEYPNGMMDPSTPRLMAPDAQTFGTFDAKMGNQG